MSQTADSPSILYEAANLYYEHQFSQQRIADRLGISRPGVSRLLQKARERGIVRIQVIDPTRKGTLLENELADAYHIPKVIIIPNTVGSRQQLNQRLGQEVNRYLDEVCEDGMVIGTSWGSTMQAVSRSITQKSYRNMTIVQLNGGVSGAHYDTHAAEIIQRFGECCQAVPFQLQLPAVVDNAAVKEAVMSDRNIAKTLNLAVSATVAIFTVGSFGKDSALVKAEYLEESEVSFLIENDAVGDICSRIFNSAGEIVSPELNARTIGVDLHQISDKEHAIAVAGGTGKIAAIRGALAGHLMNVLITDEQTARVLIDLEGEDN